MLSLPQGGWQVLGANLNCSESDALLRPVHLMKDEV
jgi:hypothetical protein